MTATWTQPRTWSVGELTTAALMNQHMRDNFDWLKTPPQDKQDISATVSVTATSFTDVLTSVITTAGGALLAGFHGVASLSGAAGVNTLSWDVTVDGTSIAGVGGVQQYTSSGAGYFFNAGFVVYIPAINAGSHTFKLRALVSAGSASLYGSAIGKLGRFWVREF